MGKCKEVYGLASSATGVLATMLCNLNQQASAWPTAETVSYPVWIDQDESPSIQLHLCHVWDRCGRICQKLEAFQVARSRPAWLAESIFGENLEEDLALVVSNWGCRIIAFLSSNGHFSLLSTTQLHEYFSRLECALESMHTALYHNIEAGRVNWTQDASK